MGRKDFFEGVSQTPRETSAGDCPLPILYHDASLIGLFYRVDRDRADALLADTPFDAIPIMGKAVAFLCAFEYRETTVGVYNEVGLAILARQRGTKPSLFGLMRDMRKVETAGLYVTNLPVTTEAARAAGKEIWGYPKYVTGIDTRFDADGATEIVLEDEFRLTAGRPRGLSTRGLPFVTWTVHGGRMIRTVINVGHKTKWGGSSKVDLQLLGEGPTASSLRALGVDGSAKPWWTFRTNAMRSILPAGVDMGPADAAAEPSADRDAA